MGGDRAGNLIVFDLIRLSSPEQTGYYSLGKALGTFLMLATAQPSAANTAWPDYMKSPPMKEIPTYFALFCHPPRVPFPFRRWLDI
jgi:hypothetical protein